METTLDPNTPLARFLAARASQELHTVRDEIRAEMERHLGRVRVLEEQLATVEWALAQASPNGSGPVETARAEPTHQRPTRVPPRRLAEGQLSLRHEILAVMHEQRKPWERNALLAELRRRGKAPEGKNPANTLGNRLSEMVTRGELVKVKRGVFALPFKPNPLNEEEVPIA